VIDHGAAKKPTDKRIHPKNCEFVGYNMAQRLRCNQQFSHASKFSASNTGSFRLGLQAPAELLLFTPRNAHLPRFN
jgi:hypothetical protein